MEKIIETLKKVTDNFETGFHSSTCMGWKPNYDLEGRPLNCDPNFRDGNITIEGKEYFFVRKGWWVLVWDKYADYLHAMKGEKDYIAKVDLRPNYLKQNNE